MYGFEVVVVIATLLGPITIVLPQTYPNVDDKCDIASKYAVDHIRPELKAVSFCRPRLSGDL